MGNYLYPTKKNTQKMNYHEKNEIIRPEGKNKTINNKIKTFADKKENLKKLGEKEKIKNLLFNLTRFLLI